MKLIETDEIIARYNPQGKNKTKPAAKINNKSGQAPTTNNKQVKNLRLKPKKTVKKTSKYFLAPEVMPNRVQGLIQYVFQELNNALAKNYQEYQALCDYIEELQRICPYIEIGFVCPS